MYRYTSCKLTTLHYSKVSFLQCCHIKDIMKYLQKCEGCTHFCEILYIYLLYNYYIIIIYYCIYIHCIYAHTRVCFSSLKIK